MGSPGAVPPVDSELEHHSDKNEFCSDFNKQKGCELSECLLKAQQKFEDFQAKYDHRRGAEPCGFSQVGE